MKKSELNHRYDLLLKKKKELEKLPPIKPEWKKRLDDKYRLEWNFHSNHIEGNTLTYGETQMLLFFGKATGEHEKRDYDEIEAHDLAINLIKDWSNDPKRDITESELRQLNQVILVKPFWKEAITQDGQPTRKQIFPGQYKTAENSVRLKSGEIHAYAAPEETPALMQKLFSNYVAKKFQNPIERAAWVHHAFTSIHPFDDGNGRVARLWINFFLLREGFPPLIIRSKNKEQYLTALQKADIGDLEPFVNYLIEEMSWSVDLSLKASQGESVQEQGDLDKEIKLFVKENTRDQVVKKNRSLESTTELYHNFFKPLIESLHEKLSFFDVMFFDNKSRISINGGSRDTSDLFGDTDSRISTHLEALSELRYIKEWRGYKHSENAFSIKISLAVEFLEFSYLITGSAKGISDEQKLYHLVISSEEKEELLSKVVHSVMDEIETKKKSS